MNKIKLIQHDIITCFIFPQNWVYFFKITGSNPSPPPMNRGGSISPTSDGHNFIHIYMIKFRDFLLILCAQSVCRSPYILSHANSSPYIQLRFWTFSYVSWVVLSILVSTVTFSITQLLLVILEGNLGHIATSRLKEPENKKRQPLPVKLKLGLIEQSRSTDSETRILLLSQ